MWPRRNIRWHSNVALCNLLHEIAFPFSLILTSVPLFWCIYAHVRAIYTDVQIPLANCVYGNTYELVQPTAGSPLRVCIYTRIHTYARVYIYGTIKVQVNRGGGLHDSAASKFCGSYVASENAHHTTPKPKPRASIFFLVYFAKNTAKSTRFAKFRL